MNFEYNLRELNLPKFLLHVDSAEAQDRIFALDILGQCLNDIDDVNSNHLTDAFKKNPIEVPLTFAILTRCDDVLPLVRAKALTVLSQNMSNVLQLLNETRNRETFELEDVDDVTQDNLDINGNHRFFWYRLKSFKERRIEFEAILKRRVNDRYAATRKAALAAVESMLMWEPASITKENLKCFESASNDDSVIVRKQVIQSLSDLCNAYRENPRSVILESWLQCILPLTQDSENSVKIKALESLEEQFLQNIFYSAHSYKMCSLSLLKTLSSGDLLAYRGFFRTAFRCWKLENKLRSEMVTNLDKQIGTEWEECVWFYLSCFVTVCNLPSTISQLCVIRFTELSLGTDHILCVEYMLKIMVRVIHMLPTETLEILQHFITGNLKSFSVPVEFIPIVVRVLLKVHRLKDMTSEFESFSSEICQKCQEKLSASENTLVLPSEEQMARCFWSLTEFCQHSSSNISPDVIALLKRFLIYAQQSMEPSLPPSLKAHIFAAVGKVCLQDSSFARELLPVFAKEIMLSKHPVIRNNISIILIDICRLNPSMADQCIPLLVSCFKDRHYLIRYQTIVLLTNLLREGHLRWQNLLFFCFLSTLIDPNEAVRVIGQDSLCEFLKEKKSVFSDHFVESIFVFNNFPPQDNKIIAENVKRLERFAAIPGENKREKRMVMYRFLLESMDAKERVCLIGSVCEILTNVAESVYFLNSKTECIIRDCFAILKCNSIRVINLEGFDCKGDEEMESELSKTELSIRRVVNVDPVIPAVVRLKNSIWIPESDLMQDIILFLKHLLQDFREKQKDILSGDSVLLKQLQLEIMNDEERERREKSIREDLLEKNKQAETETNTSIPLLENEAIQEPIIIDHQIGNSNRCLEEEAEGSGSNRSGDESHQS